MLISYTMQEPFSEFTVSVLFLSPTFLTPKVHDQAN